MRRRSTGGVVIPRSDPECSHGQDLLSLWKLGASELVGLDISREMLALAREKAARLGAPARFIEGDVLTPPADLDGWADLLYTGRGALPWVRDLTRWASNAHRILRPGGHLVMHEGHPLNWVWDVESSTLVAQHGYFDTSSRPNADFPALAVEARTGPGDVAPTAWEHQWTLGAIVTALAHAGLVIEQLTEFADQFWPQFTKLPDETLRRLPHSFLVVARRGRE